MAIVGTVEDSLGLLLQKDVPVRAYLLDHITVILLPIVREDVPASNVQRLHQLEVPLALAAPLLPKEGLNRKAQQPPQCIGKRQMRM